MTEEFGWRKRPKKFDLSWAKVNWICCGNLAAGKCQ